MLMPDVWSALAESHEILPTADSSVRADVVLRGPAFPATPYDVRTVSTLHPSRVRRFADPAGITPEDLPQVLVITASATPAAVDAALTARVSVLIAPEHGPVSGTLIDSDGQPHTVDAGGERNPAPDRAPSRPGRPAWGTFALAYALLGDATPRSQTALAREVGVTQARVSQSLTRLRHLVARRPSGWTTTHPSAIAHWLAAEYPRPGTAAAWLTLDEPVPATRRIADLLTHAGVAYAVAGQVAADSYAPWSRPTRSIIWTDRLVDLSAAGCTPVTEAEASVIIAVPDDPRALTQARERDGLVLADPWRTWVTLVQSGDDAAAEHLLVRLLTEAAA